MHCRLSRVKKHYLKAAIAGKIHQADLISTLFYSKIQNSDPVFLFDPALALLCTHTHTQPFTPVLCTETMKQHLTQDVKQDNFCP